MKTIWTGIIFLFSSTSIFACSCSYSGNFIQWANNSPVVVKAKIIKSFYHFEDGKRINQEHLHEFKNYVMLKGPQFIKSVQIEIIQVIKGEENRKVVEIFGSDGADCRATVNDLTVGKIYVFAMHYSTASFSNLPNETDTDFILWGCAESWIKFNSATNTVIGKIKGKSNRRKTQVYNYKRLLKNIT